MIKTKSAAEPASKKDGLRLYVTRYWPRGHSRDECDEWMPNLAPSEQLLHQFQQGNITWPVFQRRYKAEMMKGLGSEIPYNERMRNGGQKYVLRLLRKLAETSDITLICSCAPDQKHCHRHTLQCLIES